MNIQFIQIVFLISVIVSFGCNEKEVNSVKKDVSDQEELESPFPENVILVVIDGPRWDHTFGDTTRKYIPNLDELAQKGTVYVNCFNNGITYTNPGHVALSTGVYEEIDNLGKTIPQNTSFMHDYLLKSKNPNSTWLITSKDKLEILSKTRDTSIQYFPKVDCGVSGLGSGYRHDTVTYNRVIAAMEEQKPNVIFVNFREPDYSAHKNDMNGYYSGLKRCDSLVMELWKFIEKSPVYAENTALIITNDHGRHIDGHKDGLVNHGDDCEGCRRISCVGIGKGFNKGTVITDSIDLLGINKEVRMLLQID